MKKRISMVLAVALMIVGLGACNPRPDPCDKVFGVFNHVDDGLFTWDCPEG